MEGCEWWCVSEAPMSENDERDAAASVRLGQLFGELFAALEERSVSFEEASARFRAAQAGQALT